MKADFDFDDAVFVEFGRTVAVDLVHFIETLPDKEDDAAGILTIEVSLGATEGLVSR